MSPRPLAEAEATLGRRRGRPGDGPDDAGAADDAHEARPSARGRAASPAPSAGRPKALASEVREVAATPGRAAADAPDGPAARQVDAGPAPPEPAATGGEAVKGPARARRPARPGRGPAADGTARTPVPGPVLRGEHPRREARPRPRDPGRLATGIRLLDDLLGGGLPPASTVLLCGPAFLGKEVLARSAALRAMAAGVPCIYVVASKPPEEVHEDLLALGEDAAAVLGGGLLHFVDAFSSTLGEKSAWPGTQATKGPDDLEALDRVLSAFDERFRGRRHLVIVDSVSDLAVASPADRVFRFLQVTMGRARRARATCLLLMDEGMHGAEEVQMVRHLAGGALTVRGDTTRRQILVEGLDVPENPGWIEYASTSSRFEMTGSLAGGRIR